MILPLVQSILKENPEYSGFENVIEKEIFHHDILSVLHQNGLLNDLTFIGGTSLRMCHGWNRLSEDLDFNGGMDFTPEKFSSLADIVAGALSKKYMLDINVVEPKPMKGDTSTWRVSIEKDTAKRGGAKQKIHIDICRYETINPIMKTASNFYPFQSPIEGLPIPCQSLDEIFVDKIIAFAMREYSQRIVKPRDLWDITFLNNRHVQLDNDVLTQKLSQRGIPFDVFHAKVLNNLNSVETHDAIKQDFRQEMSRFVLPELAKNTLGNEYFWDVVKRAHGEAVSSIIIPTNAPQEQSPFANSKK
jgi:predicted nucleotidyltransferase component of viral defense system